MSSRRTRDTSCRAWFRTALLCVALLPASACHFHRVEPWERAPMGKDQVEKVRVTSQGQDFLVERVRFFSEELQEPRFFLVLTPAADSNTQNVVILNHGWADRPEEMLTSLGIAAVYQGLLASGRASSARLVLPDVRFPEAFRRNEQRYPFKQYLVLIGEEVAGLVSRLYNVPFDRERWGIGGFSFGGYISLDVARRYPGRFGRVSVISSFYDKDWAFWPSEPPSPGLLDGRGRGKQTVVVPGPAPTLMLACGTQDPLIASMRELNDRFTQLGIRHEWSTAAGGHTWTYWKSVLPSMLAFHLPPKGAEPGARSWRGAKANAGARSTVR